MACVRQVPRPSSGAASGPRGGRRPELLTRLILGRHRFRRASPNACRCQQAHSARRSHTCMDPIAYVLGPCRQAFPCSPIQPLRLCASASWRVALLREMDQVLPKFRCEAPAVWIGGRGLARGGAETRRQRPIVPGSRCHMAHLLMGHGGRCQRGTTRTPGAPLDAFPHCLAAGDGRAPRASAGEEDMRPTVPKPR